MAGRRARVTTQKTEREVCPTCGHTTTTVVADGVLARAIFEKRRAEKLTLRQAADQADVSQSTLCRIERGKMPDVENAVKIAAWLGQSLDALFLPARAQRGRP